MFNLVSYIKIKIRLPLLIQEILQGGKSSWDIPITYFVVYTINTQILFNTQNLHFIFKLIYDHFKKWRLGFSASYCRTNKFVLLQLQIRIPNRGPRRYV